MALAKRVAWTAVAAAAGAALAGRAMAGTVMFDDRPAGSVSIPNGYAGLNWTNFYTYDHSAPTTVNSGFNYGVVSPNKVAYNFGAAPATFAAPAGTLDLSSVYVTSVWNDGLAVTIEGYNGATLVKSVTLAPFFHGPTLYRLNWSGVTSVTMSSGGGTLHDGVAGLGTQFAMDNLTVNANTNAWQMADSANGTDWNNTASWLQTGAPAVGADVFVTPNAVAGTTRTLVAGGATSAVNAITVGANGGGTAVLNVAAGGTVSADNGVTVAASGKLELNGGTLTTNGLANGGQLQLNSGTLNVRGQVTSSTLSLGKNVTMNLTGDAAVGTLSQKVNTLSVAGTLNVGANTLTVNSVNGTQFVATGGSPATVTLAGGTIQDAKGFGGSANISGYGMFAGDFAAGDVTVAASEGIVFQGNTTGSMKTSGAIAFEGTVAPGHQSGARIGTISGDWLDFSAADLYLQLGKTTTPVSDQIVSSGEITIGGSLTVSLDGQPGGATFMPAEGDRFQLLLFSSLEGEFASVNLPALSGGLFWDDSKLYTEGSITVLNYASVPEAGTAMLGMVAVVALAGCRKRRVRGKSE